VSFGSGVDGYYSPQGAETGGGRNFPFEVGGEQGGEEQHFLFEDRISYGTLSMGGDDSL